MTSLAYQANVSGVEMNGFNVGLVTFKHFGESLSGAKGGTGPYTTINITYQYRASLQAGVSLTEAFPKVTIVPNGAITSKSSSQVSFPTPSYTTLTPFPPVRSLIFFTLDSEEAVLRRTCSAPFCFASSAFSAVEVVAITCAPRYLQNYRYAPLPISSLPIEEKTEE